MTETENTNAEVKAVTAELKEILKEAIRILRGKTDE
jgi:hypothetical protein